MIEETHQIVWMKNTQINKKINRIFISRLALLVTLYIFFERIFAVFSPQTFLYVILLILLEFVSSAVIFLFIRPTWIGLSNEIIRLKYGRREKTIELEKIERIALEPAPGIVRRKQAIKIYMCTGAVILIGELNETVSQELYEQIKNRWIDTKNQAKSSRIAA